MSSTRIKLGTNVPEVTKTQKEMVLCPRSGNLDEIEEINSNAAHRVRILIISITTKLA